MSQEQAQIVAHSCQYVDDATTPGVLEFSDGETFDRFASAHKLFDYRNVLDLQNRVVWAPFHFLPGGQGNSLEEKSICQPDSPVAKAMARRAIDGRSANNSLHRLGVTLHVYVDTWAHQGFSGTVSKHNTVTFLEGDDHDHNTWLGKLKAYLVDAGENAESLTLDTISRLGHGAALHFPDMPWAKWKYTNGYNQKIERNNLPDFIQAADMSCKIVQGFLNGNDQYENEPGLRADSRQALHNLLASNQDHNEENRLDVLTAGIAKGSVPGIKEDIPKYIAKGEGSWKHAATGIIETDDGGAKPKWSQKFEDSDYRKFHDAIKQHRFVVTQEILPDHHVRLA
ncbi:MAG: hypothetical protein NVS3B3_19540 [Aquirhabdus sp.]